MKTITSYAVLLLIALLSWQCSDKKSFTIEGQIIGFGNDTIVLQEMIENGLSPAGTITTDQNGHFSFSDTAINPRFIFMTMKEKYISLLLLNGQNLVLSANMQDINSTYTITGSRESELVWELNKNMQIAALELDSLTTLYEQLKLRGDDLEADSWFRRKYQDLLADQKDYIRQFISLNYNSPASLMALSHQLDKQPVLNRDADFAYFARVDSSLSDQYPNSRMAKTLHHWVIGQKQQKSFEAAENNSVGVGVEAPDIILENPDGITIALSSLRGQYVLLDFWAAWCAPCRRENPNLLRAYNEFHDKGFEIYQVSLDKSRDEWIAAIKNDKLDWTQVSDLKFWGSPAAKLYYVKSIPANFLIDPEGKIIAKNLRGQALEQKLIEILK